MHRTSKNILPTLLLALVGAFLTLPAAAQDPYAMPNDTWISIDGIVETVHPDAFMLDYGEGTITVEMDDGDRDADAYKLLKGDKVTVFGVIDDDFLEARTIEAASVYVDKLGTTFYASALDEEDAGIPFVYVASPPVISTTIMQGTVSDVRDGEFTLDTGSRMITVDVGGLSYDPVDDEGYQQIDVGDRVWVSGDIDFDLFEGREFSADSIVILDDAEVNGD